MPNGTTTHVVRGTLNWAKVLGEPILNTYTDEREWSVDLTPDAKGLAEFKRIGITNKMKDPKETDKRKEKFIALRQREFRTDRKTGEKTANRPITITDVTGQPWDQSKKLGNGTVADVKFNVKDNGKALPKGVYIQAIRVLQHVAYEAQEFAPLSADDEFFSASTGEGGHPEGFEDTAPSSSDVNTVDDLDDEVPFD